MDTAGFVIWLTGLPAAGKSALAQELRCRLAGLGVPCVILDSDELRAVVTPHAIYTPAEREWFYSVMVHLAAWLARSGVNVLVAATAHRRAVRQQARAQIQRFAEVYVRCPLETCQARDRKGLYESAARGQAGTVPGVGVPYEPPLAPEAVVDTSQHTAAEAAGLVLVQLGPMLTPADSYD